MMKAKKKKEGKVMMKGELRIEIWINHKSTLNIIKTNRMTHYN